MVAIVFSLVLLVFLFISMSTSIVPEGYEWIVEDLGKKRNYTLKPGLHFLTPFVSNIRAKVSTKEQNMNLFIKNIQTEDNAEISINLTVFYRIIEPIKAVYEVENLRESIATTAEARLREIISRTYYGNVFTSHDSIKEDIYCLLKSITAPWGCEIKRVEIVNSQPSEETK